MGKILLDNGDALAQGQSTTVEVPAHMKIASFEISLTGSTSSSPLPVDDILDIKLKRQFEGNASHSTFQEIRASLVHRIGRYYRPGDVQWTNAGGGSVDLQILLDQWVPTLPGNVLHTMSREEVKLELNWQSLGNASSLGFEVHAITDQSGAETYVRRLGVTDLQLTSGETKKRQTEKNCHTLWIFNPDSVLKDNSFDASEWIRGNEEVHYEEQGFGDLERLNQPNGIIDDTGIMDNFTRAQIAEAMRREEHVNDGVKYEVEGSGTGTIDIVHDRVDFDAAMNRRSAQQLASRTKPRLHGANGVSADEVAAMVRQQARTN